MLAAFAKKGRLPPKEVVHWILRRLLNEWGLELQHLNPTRVPHVAGFVTVYEAFLGMEPLVDFFRRIFIGRALSEGRPTRTVPVGGFTPAAAQVGQFTKFDEMLETSSSHGGHIMAGSVLVQELPYLYGKV